ncbi:hypothetical protein B0H66DRAFT_613686 [Apodospora peruviana]|uniref:Uncharacterized protein n=1 Tax=Apodospora peruviana TaxID=516989 RepID=A0AAE0IUS9_9PEZI|nr:hypothetical protein B0H66DRAFT_613686 [Apodospora peruviana]
MKRTFATGWHQVPDRLPQRTQPDHLAKFDWANLQQEKSNGSVVQRDVPSELSASLCDVLPRGSILKGIVRIPVPGPVSAPAPVSATTTTASAPGATLSSLPNNRRRLLSSSFAKPGTPLTRDREASLRFLASFDDKADSSPLPAGADATPERASLSHELRGKLTLGSEVSTSSSAAESHELEQGVGKFRKIGARACGAVFSEDVTSVVVKLAKDSDSAELWNDYYHHIAIRGNSANSRPGTLAYLIAVIIYVRRTWSPRSFSSQVQVTSSDPVLDPVIGPVQATSSTAVSAPVPTPALVPAPASTGHTIVFKNLSNLEAVVDAVRKAVADGDVVSGRHQLVFSPTGAETGQSRSSKLPRTAVTVLFRKFRD